MLLLWMVTVTWNTKAIGVVRQLLKGGEVKTDLSLRPPPPNYIVFCSVRVCGEELVLFSRTGSGWRLPNQAFSPDVQFEKLSELLFVCLSLFLFLFVISLPPLSPCLQGNHQGRVSVHPQRLRSTGLRESRDQCRSLIRSTPTIC